MNPIIPINIGDLDYAPHAAIVGFVLTSIFHTSHPFAPSSPSPKNVIITCVRVLSYLSHPSYPSPLSTLRSTPLGQTTRVVEL